MQRFYRYGSEMRPADFGDYVLYADHRAVEEELAALKASRCDTCPVHPSVVGISAVEEELAKAKADIREMVNKAADKHLEGYRELGRKVAAAEEERDRLSKQCEVLSKVINSQSGKIAALTAEVKGLREQYSDLIMCVAPFTTPADLFAVYGKIYAEGRWEAFMQFANSKCDWGNFDPIRNDAPAYLTAWLFCLNAPDQIGERMEMVGKWLEERK